MSSRLRSWNYQGRRAPFKPSRRPNSALQPHGQPTAFSTRASTKRSAVPSWLRCTRRWKPTFAPERHRRQFSRTAPFLDGCGPSKPLDFVKKAQQILTVVIGMLLSELAHLRGVDEPLAVG